MAYKLGRRKVIVRRQFNYELYTLLQLKNYNDDKMRANGENMGGKRTNGKVEKGIAVLMVIYYSYCCIFESPGKFVTKLRTCRPAIAS